MNVLLEVQHLIFWFYFLIQDYFGVHVYPQERDCAMLGGMCVHTEDCEPSQLTSTKGLCPNFRDLGVECCYQGWCSLFLSLICWI